MNTTESTSSMPIGRRFLWGVLAGVAIVCVKIIGPDQDHVRSLFLTGVTGAIAFYVFISCITVTLGGISGLFAEEKKPQKMLIFCASLPAIVSMALGTERESQTTGDADMIALYSQDTHELGGMIISGAYAEEQSDDGVCDEGTFLEQFTDAANRYLTRAQASETYRVIVASEPDFERAGTIAEALADRLSDADINLQVSVGCRRPGNIYYPVIVGEDGSQSQARQIQGILSNAGVSTDSYLSNYAWRSNLVVLSPDAESR